MKIIEREELILNSESIRKNWLTSWKALFAYHLFILAGCLYSAFDSSGFLVFLLCLGIGLVQPILIGISYKCAYEKPGTKYLLFAILMAISGAVGGFRALLDRSEHTSSVILAVGGVLSIWFVTTSLSLRQLNKLRSTNNSAV